jgi:hypothetical protein
MIDIVRRHEHNFLRTTSRQWIGKYVDTTTQSCQLHDSNLVNVELSRRLRWFDLNEPDPFHSLAPLSTIRGNKFGGFVLSGEEREELAPGALLDLEVFATIDFATESSWPIPRIANQLKLRNLQKAKRSATLTRLLTEAHGEEGSAPLLGRAESLLVSGKRSELIQRLERVVQIEERALHREEEDRWLDAVDRRQQAQDNRRRRVRRLPSHLRDD